MLKFLVFNENKNKQLVTSVYTPFFNTDKRVIARCPPLGILVRIKIKLLKNAIFRPK